MELRFSDVHVELGGNPILGGVDLVVPSGEVVGLVGANGSGKSTLLRAAYRVHRPSKGTVHVGGDDVHRLPAPEVARRIAVMAQEITNDFPMTVLDVVLLGRVPHQRGFGVDSPADLALAHDSLAEVGAADLHRRVFSSLSGGEKQRVLLARALTQQAPVLILDEPTNHADLGFQHELLHLVTHRGATVLAALHDVNLALTYCRRAVVLDQGTVCAEGPVESVLTPAVVDQVLRVSSRALPDPRGGTVLSFRRPSTPTRTDPVHELIGAQSP
ncbi:ABC transporter ATP-binding protein [Arsenicicoccus dermatophilus]|uniref:ABC transporter ATP-binding protein n=1 Tax=Arsenicicoccus dermatophilus TaxID=1076331 RepID=UPI001F4D0977|nr:ABC transporter ATP-binding protein [Arsenicicoccus dermatophilus]MCH8614419.1 ABC transporter ATP-binding protein [Arsenicicoccus dermatophilus]